MFKQCTILLLLLCVLIFTTSTTDVFAKWYYSELPVGSTATEISLGVGEFVYFPTEMPDNEVHVLERLNDILNRKYQTDKITDSLDYLINETIQVYWGGNIYADPYVGSMDANFATQISELFRDVLFDTGVSFILKNQDLNGDGYREIAMYSTSDPLDCEVEYDGIVCVYVTVFTPTIDENKNIVGYHMVCESLRGYCYEVYYGQGDTTPSFSTDEWRNDIGYWHYFDECIYIVPDDAMSVNGDTPYKLDYYSYNKSYQYGEYYWASTLPYGLKLCQCLSDKIPYLM